MLGYLKELSNKSWSQRSSGEKAFSVIVGIPLLVGGIWLVFSLYKPKVEKIFQREPVQIMQTDIKQLLSAYSKNEIAADNIYKGKYIETTGVIGDIGKDVLNNAYITVGTGKKFEIPTLQAYFSNNMLGVLGQLNTGEKVTVICKITGLMINIQTDDCQIK